MSSEALQSSRSIIPSLRPDFEKILIVIGTSLLFSVKINLLSVAGQSAGLRLDDVILLGVGLLLGAAFLFSGRTVVHRMELQGGIIFTTLVVSNIINIFWFSRSNILYSIRFVEYFLFFYIGYYFARSHSLRTVAKWILLANAAVMILQALELVGGYTSEGYVAAGGIDRVVGLTGGPWEVGTILNFCLAILLKRGRGRGIEVYNLLLFLATFTLVILTGARMPAIAHVAILSIFLIRRAQHPIRVVVTAAVASILALVLLLSIPNPIQARSTNLFSGENIQAFADYYKAVTPSQQVTAIPWDNGQGGVAEDETESLDLSWALRLIKWGYMIKLWVLNPFSWLIGLGPGVCGPSLDGAWLRLAVETGVIGLVAFTSILISIARLNEIAEGLVIALGINMLMTDTHIAYKAMSFFFFATGCFYRVQVGRGKPLPSHGNKA